MPTAITHQVKGTVRMWTKQALGLLMIAAAAYSQPRPGMAEYNKATDETRRLLVTLSLDRPWYIEGERVCATVIVVNSGAKALQVFQPFDSPFTSITLSRSATEKERERMPGVEWTLVGDSHPKVLEDAGGNMMDHRKLIVLSPGETQSASTCPTSLGAAPFGEGVGFGSYRAGRYRLCFSYEMPACSEFEVVKVEGRPLVSQVPLPEYAGTVDLARRETGSNCIGMRASAFQSARGVHIMVSSPTTDICSDDDFRGGIENVLWQRILVTRISDSTGPISSLSIKALNPGEVEVSWTEAGGRAVRRTYAPQITPPKSSQP